MIVPDFSGVRFRRGRIRSAGLKRRFSPCDWSRSAGSKYVEQGRREAKAYLDVRSQADLTMKLTVGFGPHGLSSLCNARRRPVISVVSSESQSFLRNPIKPPFFAHEPHTQFLHGTSFMVRKYGTNGIGSNHRASRIA